MHIHLSWEQVVAIVGTLVGLALSIRYYMLYEIKKELFDKAEKVPTVICDKGHVYPEELGLRITDVPGIESDVRMCPICYDINMKAAVSSLKEMVKVDDKKADKK